MNKEHDYLRPRQVLNLELIKMVNLVKGLGLVRVKLEVVAILSSHICGSVHIPSNLTLTL